MRYHFVLTLQWQYGLGTALTTADGSFDAKPDDTRATAFKTIAERVKQPLGPEAAKASVLFWSLEPDTLPVPAETGW